jgi:hypothetical protein
MKWIKASERLPEIKYSLQSHNIKYKGVPHVMIYISKWCWLMPIVNDSETRPIKEIEWEFIEWLDETPEEWISVEDRLPDDFMSNLEKWCKAILNEDADKMSIGSVRTIQLIKQEFERLQKECLRFEKDLEDAAGELLIEIPHPHSDMAKVISANKILRDRVSELESQVIKRDTLIHVLKENTLYDLEQIDELKQLLNKQ